MPREPSRFKRAVVAGTMAASFALGGQAAAREAAERAQLREHAKQVEIAREAERHTSSDFRVRGSEIEKRELFRQGLEQGKRLRGISKNDEARYLKLMDKYQKGQLTPDEAREMANAINAELGKEAKISIVSGLEIKQMGLTGDITKMPKYAWHAVLNLEEHYVLVPLAELMMLFTYLGLARKIRQRGFSKVLETDASWSHIREFGDLSTLGKIGLLPLAIVVANNPISIGLALGAVANPKVRSQMAQWFSKRNRGSSSYTPERTARNKGPGTGTRLAEYLYKGDKEEPTVRDIRDHWEDRAKNALDRLAGFDPKKRKK